MLHSKFLCHILYEIPSMYSTIAILITYMYMYQYNIVQALELVRASVHVWPTLFHEMSL